jgi:tetratricopeptide (TPR) repeat protein
MCSAPPTPERARPWRPAALLAGATLAVFLPTLSADFVYDARMQILTDPFLHDVRNWWPVLTFQTLGMDVLDFNRPVNLASLMLDAALWGREPFGYHLTSVLLHAANVLLVWAVWRRLAAEAGPGTAAHGSWLVAATAILPPLLFAVHPLVTEAVCEPTFREDLLVAFFTLAALLLAMHHPAGAAGSDPWRAAACIACCLLAIGSKESGIAAPAVLAVWWWCFRRRDPGRFWAAAIGGGVAVVAAFLALRFRLEVIPSRIFEHRPQYPGGSFAAAMAFAPRILALYAQLVVAPVNQCADYGSYSVRHLPPPVAVVVVGTLVLAAGLGVRRDRRLAVAVALIVLPLVPVANLVPIYRAAADRYLYLPLAGVALATGCLIDAPWLAGRAALRRHIAWCAVAVAALLAVGCTARQRVWAGAVPLWEDAFRKNPVAFTAAAGYAEALREAGRLAEAEPVARTAIRLTGGRRGEAWATLALVLDDQGRAREAAAALDEALAADPRLARPLDRVAALAMERPYAEALGRLVGRRPASP